MLIHVLTIMAICYAWAGFFIAISALFSHDASEFSFKQKMTVFFAVLFAWPFCIKVER
jgi:hypothetical protein